MRSEPRYVEGQYQYPCGYRSDYKFPTVAQAKFYDAIDVAVSRATDNGVSVHDVDAWLFDIAATGSCPDA